MEAAGMRAKVSLIHVNGWFGDYPRERSICGARQEKET